MHPLQNKINSLHRLCKELEITIQISNNSESLIIDHENKICYKIDEHYNIFKSNGNYTLLDNGVILYENNVTYIKFLKFLKLLDALEISIEIKRIEKTKSVISIIKTVIEITDLHTNDTIILKPSNGKMGKIIKYVYLINKQYSSVQLGSTKDIIQQSFKNAISMAVLLNVFIGIPLLFFMSPSGLRTVLILTMIAIPFIMALLAIISSFIIPKIDESHI